MTKLPLPERIAAEVLAYTEEYKAPMSIADLSVELESRGKDDEFQNKTENYAHANDDWLPAILERLIAQGKLRKSEDGGYLPAPDYEPPRGDFE